MFGLFAAFSGGLRPEALTLEAGDLRLRVPRPEDYAPWAELRARSRAFLEPWEPLWPADDLTPHAFRRRLARYRHEIRTDSAYPFFLFERSTNRLLGGLTITHIRRRAAMSGTLGYWMGEPFAGRGLMSAAVPALCRHAFSLLELERIEAACLPENAASLRVLEKAGFQREGFARSYLSIAGARRDHLLLALLKSDLARR